MAAQGRELATARLNDQRLDDLRQWVELDQQQKALTERLHTRSIPGHEASQQLEILWHEKALIADRLLSVLAPQWVGDDGDVYLPLPSHVAIPKAKPADHSELPPAVCYLKAQTEPERLDDGSPCQQCGTVDEDKPRQWVHNQLTGHQYLCPSCEASQPDINQPGVLERFLKRLHL
ncbi:hypothetical protein CFI10_03940 [Marinobacterium iners]|uniref:hypothetical protein n=1 Tax=Marinobacterium iners TaxID=48076 RepID=UPI001A9084A1|nr:hypothetical protein [Marinobacterium iners]QSR34145.1 hypothetical protein CFI10_03940 [Marinobacterium iners]